MKMLVNKVRAVLMVIAVVGGLILNLGIYTVEASDSVLTSPEISVLGFQIKTNVNSRQGVSFRAVCQAPEKGSIITVDGERYTVTNVGTIYAKDINTSGNNENNVLDKTYTELNPKPFLESTVEYGFKYIGFKPYLNKNVAFGYIATNIGIIQTDNGYSKYVRTLTNMDPYIRNSILVRGFVEAKNGRGEETLIYGQYAKVVSVAEIAYKVYMEGKAPNVEGHNYIFNTILHRLPKTSPYYKETEEEYGWSGGVVGVNP